MKLIGLCGTHGTGKTTLMKAFEGKAVLVETSVSAIYKEMGLNPQLPMTLDTRLDVQDRILSVLMQEWMRPFANNTGEGPQIALTDRTPMCLIGYLLCEVSGYGELTEEQNARVQKYVDVCLAAAGLFDHILHVPIGLPMVKRDKVVAAQGIAYRLHLDMAMKGALSNIQHTHSLFGTEQSYRVKQVQSVIDGLLNSPI